MIIFLKLCGSGGGGYILGFTEDLEKAKRSLAGHKLEVVYQFLTMSDTIKQRVRYCANPPTETA